MQIPDNLRRILKATLLVLLFIVGVIWFSNNEQQGLIPPKSIDVNTPNITLINSTTTHYDQSGLPQYTLSSEKLEHFHDNNKIHLTRPDLTARQDNENWKASSQKGIADLNTDTITLTEQVSITKRTDQQPLQISTSKVAINTIKKTVENDVYTELSSQNSVITTQGFHSDLTTGETLLKANVRGSHDIQK